VIGIDFSKRSIEYAREVAVKEGLSIQYVNQDYLKYETDERFHLILMIMCDFCALSPLQRRTMLDKFHTLLMPGGCVLLDVYSLNAFEQRQETAVFEANLLDGFWAPHDYYGFLNTFKYETEKVVLDKYTIIEPDRTRTFYNWLQYFSPEELEKELVECGFTVEGGYFDVAGSPFDSEANEFAVIGGRT
jgi:SAM-dependent methyltransferase